MEQANRHGKEFINIIDKEKCVIKLEQYRDPWLAENFDKFIGFYPREFFVFDNFSSFKVKYNGVIYSTVEHAYQATKFVESAPEIAKEITDCFSAHEAQKIAYANKDKQCANWDDIKLNIMEQLLRLKLEQNPYVKKKLMQTGDLLICEDSPKDSFWGIGKNRDGRNELGKLWMKLREELKQINK